MLVSSPVTAGFALSPKQALILGTGSSALHVTAEATLHRPLDAERVRAVVARHEILRTRFAAVPGALEPVQVVEPDGTLGLRVAGDRLSVTLPAAVADHNTALAVVWAAPGPPTPAMWLRVPPRRRRGLTLSRCGGPRRARGARSEGADSRRSRRCPGCSRGSRAC